MSTRNREYENKKIRELGEVLNTALEPFIKAAVPLYVIIGSLLSMAFTLADNMNEHNKKIFINATLNMVASFEESNRRKEKIQ